MKKRSIIIITFILLLVASVCGAKDEYPNKPIEVVIPYAAGGSADFILRIVGEKLGEILGQPIVVVCKPGGAGAVGTSFVAKSKPDGYTLLMHSCGIVARPLFDPSAPYRVSEFNPIAMFELHGHLMAVNNASPIKNIKELVDYAKKNPGAISSGGSGIGGVNYLALELLKLNTQMTDKIIQWVPYGGDVEPLVALIGNHIQVSVTTSPPCKTYVSSKQIRPLAVLATKRDPLFPDVPTAIEQGFPDVEADCYNALLAPVKTPEPIIKIMESAMEKALADKGVQEKLAKIDFEAPSPFIGSKAIRAMQDQEGKKWADVIQRANLGVKK
jgi:tripartite-type tricarboxylate transporter receptor subunit TctC